ncbi:MAG TPA: hypothetical protein VGM50_00315 [Gemmatimonadaceae bacterium]
MNALVLLLRFLHIVCAVLWVGGAALATLFLIPAVGMAGSVGGEFMQILVNRTKMTQFLPAVGGLAVLSGIGLFWRDMSTAGGSFAGSHMGITLSIGGLCGLLGLIIGGVMTGRSAKELGVVGAAVSSSGRGPTPEQGARIAFLRQRMNTGAKLSLVFLIIATIAMSVARYV